MFGFTCEEKEEEAKERQLRMNVSKNVCRGGLSLHLHLVSRAESFSHLVSMVYPTPAHLQLNTLSAACNTGLCLVTVSPTLLTVPQSQPTLCVYMCV